MPQSDPAQSDPAQTTTDPLDELNLVNAGYVADLYERYRQDPGSVEPEWRSVFDNGTGGFEPVQSAAAGGNGEQQAPQPTTAEAPQAPSVPDGATPIKGPAARLAQNMTASLAVPTATSFRELDVATLEARRKELNDQIAPRKVSFTHLIGWAIVKAASEQRSMSHYFTDADGQPYRVDPGAINLGLAVDVERRDGSRFLVVPVIKGADELDFAGFHARYEELVTTARSNKLSVDDLMGATITLTNPGTLGTAASVPRLMPNQGTIVATGTIRTVGIERRMTITSTYDHRIIQGAESGLFLARVEALLNGEDGFYADAFGSLGARASDVSTAEPEPAAAEAVAAPPPTAANGDVHEQLKAVAAAMALVKAYRHFGHMAARLDPLGSEPPGDPALDPAPLGLTRRRHGRHPRRAAADLRPWRDPGRGSAAPPGDLCRHDLL